MLYALGSRVKIDQYDGSYDVEIFLNKLTDNTVENKSVQQLK